MLIDVTGIRITPGNGGRDCLGNGSHYNNDGKLIECCCDECNYLKCCIEEHNIEECIECEVDECPRK